MAEPAATSTKTVDESGNATVVTVASGTEATAAAPEASVPKKNAAWIAEGYCPVSYFNPEGAAHKGSDDASAQAEFDGATYKLTNADVVKMFMDGPPEKFLPQYGGFCAWGIAAETQWTKATLGPDADPNVWEVIDGKLYVFMFDKPRDKFLGTLTDDDLDSSGDTATYIADGDARWEAWFGDDIAFNTDCFWWDATSDSAEKAATQAAAATARR